MTAIAPYALVTAGARQRIRRRVRAIEKASPQAHFDGERESEREQQSWICTPCESRRACRSETGEDDPFRDAPVLKSEFVAQVLGQIMEPAKSAVASQMAYQQCRSAFVAFFDEKI